MLTYYRKILKSKLTFLVLIPVLAALMFGAGQKIYSRYETGRVLAELDRQVEILKKQKSDLEDLVGYYGSESNLEKEARIRLNLKKPGEQVVIILPQATSSPESGVLKPPSEAGSLPNWERWWYYFFR